MPKGAAQQAGSRGEGANGAGRERVGGRGPEGAAGLEEILAQGFEPFPILLRPPRLGCTVVKLSENSRRQQDLFGSGQLGMDGGILLEER